MASNVQPVTGSISLVQSFDSAVGSSATYSSPVQNTPTSVSSSIADVGVYSSPPSWASTPPTSPDSVHTSVNYIPDDIQPPRTLSKSSKNVNLAKEVATVQKVSFSSVQEVQGKDTSRVLQREVSYTKQRAVGPEASRNSSEGGVRSRGSDVGKSFESSSRSTEPKFTPSISNIGNAVLRSKTADFERIIKVDTNKPKSPVMSAAEREKKKYTKRRYTDSR